MVELTHSLYTVSPQKAQIPTGIGTTRTYAGPTAAEGVMPVEDDPARRAPGSLGADCAWWLRDAEDGAMLRVVQFTGRSGGYAFRFLLSDTPLVRGRAYTCLRREERPALHVASAPALAYADLPSLAEDCVIETTEGLRKVGDLRRGDRVVTRDGDPMPLRWIGRSDLAGVGPQAPVRIEAGRFGPHRTMHLGPAHGVLVDGPAPQMLLGTEDALLPARHLVGAGVRQTPTRRVTYYHLMFDHHVLVNCGGLWVESFFPDRAHVAALGQANRAQMAHVFPSLAKSLKSYGSSVRMLLNEAEARLLAGHDAQGPTPVTATPAPIAQPPLRQAA